MDPVELQEEQPTVIVRMEDLSPGEQQDRFTIRIDAYWEHFGEDPVGRQVVASHILDTLGVEPYVRKFKATEEPKYLNLGDIERKDVGYLLVYNTEGTKLQSNPTPEEREDISKRIATIDGWEIYPNGMPFLAKPSGDSPLVVRCLHGQATLQVCIFPR